MFRLLDRLGWLVKLHMDGPVFVPAQPRRPVGEVAAPGFAGRRMRGSGVLVALWVVSRVSVTGLSPMFQPFSEKQLTAR
jgi:hypothetical protein